MSAITKNGWAIKDWRMRYIWTVRLNKEDLPPKRDLDDKVIPVRITELKPKRNRRKGKGSA